MAFMPYCLCFSVAFMALCFFSLGVGLAFSGFCVVWTFGVLCGYGVLEALGL